MGLMKLVKNAISSEWKKTFNENVDYLNGLEARVDQRNQATNKRIDNLVLNAGGDSPNEVVDARVNSEGTIFETLRERLAAGEELTEQEFLAVNQLLSEQSTHIQQLENTINELYGGKNDVIDLFVSAETGSETGDGTEESPFIRIQQAVDAIPVISGSKYVIWIESGRYLEDVVIESKRVKDITLKSVNYTTINAIEGDTDVFVRSVSITNTDNYVLIGGITFVDQANTQAMYGTVKAAIAFDLSKYVSIQSCRFAENTVARGANYSAIIGGATMCSFGGGSYVGNQSCCFSARAGAQALVSSAVEGTGSTTGFLANQAVVRIASGNRLQATTLKSEYNGGQVLGV